MATLGNSCATGSGGWGGAVTVLISSLSFPSGANITQWCVYIKTNPCNGKLKVFRDGGAQWTLVAQTDSVALSVGSNTNSCNITVQSGDMIAVYIDNTSAEIAQDSGTDTNYWYGADAGTSDKSLWVNSSSYLAHFQCTYTALNSDVYVDINKSDDTGDGLAFATAKKTMKAGWDILASTGTMHVASGDYSAQTTIAYNKSWKLSPEDPNSTGVKSVKIPKST